MRTLAAVLLALCLTACVSGGAGGGVMNRIMTSWHGAHIDDVIGQWGYPNSERTIANRRLYIWDRDVTLNMPGVANTTGRIGPYGQYTATTTYSGGGASHWSCQRLLEVDARGIVVGSQWQGNNCPFLEAGPYADWRRRSNEPTRRATASPKG